MKISNKIPEKAKGITFIIMAGFCFALMTFFVRISGELPTMQKVFFRNAIAAVVAAIMLIRSKESFKIKKSSLPWLILRSVTGFAGVILNFYAIDRIGLADSNILNKLSPFFAIILSVFILKEKPNKFETGCVITAFIGALFVIKPSANIMSVYALLGALSGLCAGAAYTMVRKLGLQGERGPIIVFFFSAFSSLCAVPFLIFDFHPMTLWQTLSLLAAGVAAAGGQLSITAAYTHAPAKEISVFDYTQVIFAAMLGRIFLDQIPDWLSILGYIIIIGSAVTRWAITMKKQA